MMYVPFVDQFPEGIVTPRTIAPLPGTLPSSAGTWARVRKAIAQAKLKRVPPPAIPVVIKTRQARRAELRRQWYAHFAPSPTTTRAERRSMARAYVAREFRRLG